MDEETTVQASTTEAAAAPAATPDVSDIEARAQAAAEQATAAQAKAEDAAALVARLKAAIAPAPPAPEVDPTQALLAELRAKIDAIEAKDTTRTAEQQRAKIRTALRSAGLTSAIADADLDAIAPSTESEIAAWIDARPGLFPGVAKGPTLADIAAAGEAALAKAPAHPIFTPEVRASMRASYLAKQESRGRLH